MRLPSLKLALAAAISAFAISAASAQQDENRYVYRPKPQVMSPMGVVDGDFAAPTWQTPTSLPGATGGESYTATISATDNSGVVTYSLRAGAPGWLSLSHEGVLTGVAPEESGTFPVPARATDPSGNYADRTFTVSVTGVPASDETDPVWQTSATLSNATGGQPWSATVTATDNVGPVTYSLESGAPSWLSINASTGELSGTPGNEAAAIEVTVRATDGAGNFALRTFSFNVLPVDETDPVWVTATNALPGGMGLDAWSATVEATDNSGEVAYSLLPGSPAWLSIDSESGEISGAIPEPGGSFEVHVRATDPSGNFADRTFSLEFDPKFYGYTKASVGNAGKFCALTETGEPLCGVGTSRTQVGDGSWRFVDVISGANFNCGLDINGQAYCWGTNGNGRLGDGTTDDRELPTPVVGSHDFTKLGKGKYHACAIDTAGDAWCWGQNSGSSSGKLGNGTNTDSYVPSLVSGGYKWKDIQGGSEFTCGVTTGGDVRCWGLGSWGRHGNGAGNTTNVPDTPVLLVSNAKKVSLGSSHACAATTAGQVFCWGSGDNYKLGNGVTGNKSTSPGAMDYVEVAAGDQHTCALKANGEAWCWGLGTGGELGNGANSTSAAHVKVAGGHTFKSLAAGDASTCGLKDNGELWCWGQGLGNAPVQVLY